MTKVLLVGKELVALRREADAESDLTVFAAPDIEAATNLAKHQGPGIALVDVSAAPPSIASLRAVMGGGVIVALIDADLPTRLKKSLLTAGFDDYAPRIHTAAALVRLVKGYVSRGGHVRPRILVVDDDPNARDLLEQQLEDAGYDVLVAADGTEALAMIRQAPRLILLDVMMPGIDGREVCRRIRADDAQRDVPVLFLSALDQIQDKLSALDAGGNDFISKPVDMDELLAKIRTMLRLTSVRQDLKRVLKE